MTITPPVVELAGVTVRRGVSIVLRNVDLSIQPGEIVGLFGGNGAGKTTLLEVLATSLRPTSGNAAVLGTDLRGERRLEVRRRIGLIGHSPALYPELSLRENLVVACRLTGAPDDRIDDVLAIVGLGGVAGRRGRECSYGMQRRTEFARELLLAPELLLMDEPHSALDVAASGLVEHLAADVTARSGAAVLVSHDRERVEKISDRSVELVGGTIGGGGDGG